MELRDITRRYRCSGAVWPTRSAGSSPNGKIGHMWSRGYGVRTKGSLCRAVTWNFLSSASVHQWIGSAGLFQTALSEMADDHAGQD